MEELAVIYHGGNYRIHAASCPDVAKDATKYGTPPRRYAAGSTILAIAREEYSDFIAEDPDYYTDEEVENDFWVNTRVLPCAQDYVTR